MIKKSLKLNFLGDYVPRRCGIATFTRDIRNAVAAIHPESGCDVLAVTDPGNAYTYPLEVRFEIDETDVQSYLRAADFLNLSRPDVLCVQHEFGIYGGPAGSLLMSLLRRARIPTVTTLHTIIEDLDEEQTLAFSELIELSTRLVSMSERGAEILREVWGVPAEKVVVIPHGIPDIPFIDPTFYKDQLGVAGRPVLLTFGLLSPGKGIEYAIQALPEIVKKHPEVVYVVLGATHPNLVRDHGEKYRISLERLAQRLGVGEHVMFVNRYVTNEELYEYIGAASIYLTPYLNQAQATSGTLAYCFGAGKAVVSTPYWHAEELLDGGRGILVPFKNSSEIARAVNELLDDEVRCNSMRKQAWMLGREMTWSHVARRYWETFREAAGAFTGSSQIVTPATLGNHPTALPDWRLDHLSKMTDSTGTFQHAHYTLPWYEHGYCTDDNARTLLFSSLLEQLREHTTESARIQGVSAAFINAAWNPEAERFRNFMSFDRKWLEDHGSEDSHGRTLWALGTVIASTRQPNLRIWATDLFERALPVVEDFSSPRAWAFTILGIARYLRRLEGDLLAIKILRVLAKRLNNLYEMVRADDWEWFENELAYDNARLPQAMLVAGRVLERESLKRVGITSLDWLTKQQTGTSDCFRPIGSNGFWKRGGEKAIFDQQPLEASATVSACLEAFASTSELHWRNEAFRAFDWFLGYNDLELPLYDASTGGTCDGLHPNRVNLNHGAESTLAFLIALARMKAHLNHVASFEKHGRLRVPSRP